MSLKNDLDENKMVILSSSEEEDDEEFIQFRCFFQPAHLFRIVKQYNVQDIICEHASMCVLKGNYKRQEIALKITSENDFIKEPKEVKFLQLNTSNQYVVDMISYEILDASTYMIIMPVLECFFPFEISEFWNYGISLLKALESFEKMQLIHKDIKPSNIMWKNGQIKIIDFDIAELITNKEHKIVTTGTDGFIAPEVENQEKYNCSVDLYSAGIVFLLFAFGLDEEWAMECEDNFSINPREYFVKNIHQLDGQLLSIAQLGLEMTENSSNRISLSNCQKKLENLIKKKQLKVKSPK